MKPTGISITVTFPAGKNDDDDDDDDFFENLIEEF